MWIVCGKAEIQNVKHDVCRHRHPSASIRIEVTFVRRETFAQKGAIMPQSWSRQADVLVCLVDAG